MDIRHCDGRDLLKSLADGSVDLILTDPPYIISHETGMNALHDAIESGKNLTKTEKEWEDYLNENDAAKTTPNAKENFLNMEPSTEQSIVSKQTMESGMR